MFDRALKLNALPVPLPRQVSTDPSDMVFPHVFIAIITKSRENELSGSHYYLVFIAILEQLL